MGERRYRVKPEDKKRVVAWLYGISRTEKAIYNLELAIDDLKKKIENPPSYIMSGVGNYSGMSYFGGEEGGSKQQSYADFMEDCSNRLSFLDDQLTKHKRKMEQFRDTLEDLKQEPKWGYLAGEIIRKKYIDKVKPDQAIYSMFLFISPEWYYKLHRRGLQYFFDVLPDVFARQEKSTV